MSFRENKNIIFAVGIFLWFGLTGVGWSHEVVAVLSSDLGPYREAFEGFREAFGKTIPSHILSGDQLKLDPDTKIVIAFGGKAAKTNYPESINLIYCLTPGFISRNSDVKAADRRGVSIGIRMLPRESTILTKLKEVHPSMKKLAVFWLSEILQRDVERLQQAASQMGIEIISQQLKNSEDLPDRLRRVYTQIDAIWLMPDPLLINSESFKVLKEFSWFNKVPLYSPSSGLVEQGATVSISTSFGDIGRLAGITARQLLSGESVQNEIYPEKTQMTVNMKAVSLIGLKIPESLLLHADKVGL